MIVNNLLLLICAYLEYEPEFIAFAAFNMYENMAGLSDRSKLRTQINCMDPLTSC